MADSGREKIFSRKFLNKVIRILKYAKPQWKLAILLFVISAVFSLLELVGPYLVKILLDDILPKKNIGLLFNLMALFIVIFVVKTITSVFYSYKTTQFVENLILRVKSELFQHLEDLDLSFYHTNKVGDILYRLDEDVYSIDSFIDLIVDVIMMNLMMTVFILAICLHMNWKITLASLTFFPFYLLAQKYFGDIVRKQKERIIKKVSDLLSFLQENLSSMKTIKEFALETVKLNEYNKRSRKLINMELKMDLTESFSGAVIGMITFTPLLVILWYGSMQVIGGVLTIGSLIAIYTYIGKLFDPISTLGSLNIAIQTNMVSVNRVFEFLDIKSKIKEKPTAMQLKDVKGKIRFDTVDFSYFKGEPVLKNVSFMINPGQVVGLVGPSGAGKSTIGNLLCRFFDPNKGGISIDGIDLRDLKLASLRQNIGIVSQEAILFNSTIRDNIKFGNITAADEEVEKAAKLANIHEFIMQQKKGYNTTVGERGVRLSEGQKQRISIARVILKNPKIIILDEATSSLDSESEKKIQEALMYVTKGRTTLVIAHRLSTIVDSDRIMVLKERKIAEEGTFEQLIKKKGIFYRFYNTQFELSSRGRNKIYKDEEEMERIKRARLQKRVQDDDEKSDSIIGKGQDVI